MIEFKNYTKTIKDNTVLEDINLVIKPGQITGLYGKNASGKTMLLRAGSGLILPSKGEVSVDGQKLDVNNRFPKSCGAVIQNCDFWPFLTALETLQYINSINKTATKEDMIQWLTRLGLDPNSKKLVRSFSLGMKQKLSLAQALFRNPRILLLDEPTNALDMESTDTFYEILQEEKAQNKTIVIASHVKDDLAICDHIIHIDGGKIAKA